ncbi:MAG: phosphoglycerate dehydrogenase [Pseudomonadota bacterium]
MLSLSAIKKAVDVFSNRGIQADFRVGLSADELIEIVGLYDGIAVRSATRIDSGILKAAKKMRVVGRAGIGVDNIDVDTATESGVVVMNTPFGNSITTAEHTVAMMMALARQLGAADRSTREGKWEKSRFMGVELYGKTLGLVGCGNVGSIVADRALGLKMRVVAYDPFLSAERAIDLGIETVDLDTLLSRADFITLHTPLNEQTQNIIDRDALRRAKPGVRIINCARGGLVDESALHEAIFSGRVAGAAIDVFATEPARSSNLFELDEVIVTPHLGASTTEAQEKVALQIAEQMADYLETGAVSNAVNMPSITAEEAPRLQPYMKLAEQLGSFAGQLTETRLEKVTITYGGHVALLNTRPITQILLTGLLRPILDSVNMVNSLKIARARGIEVTTVERESLEGYQTLVTVDVETTRGTRSVAGTLVQANDPRIVRVRNIEIEAKLSQYVLFVRNSDRPGFIGALGQLLADAQINIATFNLGRGSAGGEAVALINVDQPVPEQLLSQIRELPHVIQAQSLAF